MIQFSMLKDFIIQKVFAQNAPTEKSVEEYLIQNPVSDLKRGVINAGNMPTVGRYTENKQIVNDFGIHSGQSIMTFVLTSMLKVVGAFALFGVLYNAIMLVMNSHDDGERDNYIKGLTWSLVGLIVTLIAHVLVNIIVQMLNTSNMMDFL